MGVTATPNTEYLSGNSYLELFRADNLQKQLAKEFVESAAEDMLANLIEDDNIQSYSDFATDLDVEVKERAVDVMCEMLDNLKETLASYIEQINVKPATALFNDTGFIDGNILVEGIPRTQIKETFYVGNNPSTVMFDDIAAQGPGYTNING